MDNKSGKTLDQLNSLQKNRRHKKLQQLIDENTFFNEENLKQIECLQYYLDSGEKFKGSFSTFLQDQMIDNEYHDQLQKEFLKDQQQDCQYHKSIFQQKEIDKIALEDNIDEFIQLCHLKFLNGQYQKYFDYENTIDNNQDLDDLNIIDQDYQDLYFQNIEDQEQSLDPEMETGLQDY